MPKIVRNESRLARMGVVYHARSSVCVNVVVSWASDCEF